MPRFGTSVPSGPCITIMLEPPARTSISARVVFHGLGRKARLDRLDAERLGNLVDAVMSDQSYAKAAGLMSRVFTDHERAGRGVSEVEDAARGAIRR